MNKRKLKKGAIFVLLLILLVLVFSSIVYFVIGSEVKNIYIYGNTNLTDQEIIELAKLQDYPNFYTTSSNKIENNIKKNPLIKKVKVKKRFFQQVHIYIEEYKILFKSDDKYTLENEKEITLLKDNYNVPILINYVPNTKMESFISKLKEVDDSVLIKISEIKYDPTELDEDRFLLYMNDDNYVYITLTKLDLINKYNDAIEQLEGKKGILYLDSGNYFKIMK
ncbi:MAG: FtsQ-type POTRA domain-containing protein [bacterium]|nr:FtsQ-type POTRA domain-containing protein [bacterium]